MAKWILLMIGLVGNHSVFPQSTSTGITVLSRLDSVRNSNSVARYFGDLYYAFTLNLESNISKTPDSVQSFMYKLENTFAGFFFTAAEAALMNQEIPPVWKTYYAGTELSPIQQKLLGVNAHINGDIWQAMSKQFPVDQLEKYRKNYIAFDKSFKILYDHLYHEAYQSQKRIRDLHQLTLGMDKLYGWMVFKRWRNRQIKIAILNFSDKKRFATMYKRVQKKMKRVDRLVVRRLQ